MNELTCVNDPDNVLNGSPVTDCDKGDRGCCTIFRQEYVEEPGKLHVVCVGLHPFLISAIYDTGNPKCYKTAVKVQFHQINASSGIVLFIYLLHLRYFVV